MAVLRNKRLKHDTGHGRIKANDIIHAQNHQSGVCPSDRFALPLYSYCTTISCYNTHGCHCRDREDTWLRRSSSRSSRDRPYSSTWRGTWSLRRASCKDRLCLQRRHRPIAVELAGSTVLDVDLPTPSSRRRVQSCVKCERVSNDYCHCLDNTREFHRTCLISL